MAKIVKKPLKQREQEYRKLLESANSIILRIDLDGNLLYLNPFGLKFFGFAREEIIGKNMRGTILPEMESSGRDLSRLIRTISENPAQYETHENENLRKDGSRAWILWTNRAIRDEKGGIRELFCIGNDITVHKEAERMMQRTRETLEEKVRQRTRELQQINETLLFEIAERKVAEEALRESELRYRSIFEGALEGIFQTTAEGRCLLANDALAHMLGYDSAKEFMALATNMEEQLYADPKQRLAFRKMLEAKGRVMGFETRYLRRDGSKIWVSMNVRALYDERGSFIFYEGTVEDISLRKTNEVMDGITRALCTAIEIRDPYTAGHQERVTALAVAVAKEMNLTEDHVRAVRMAGMLHDIGKIYVPAEFLSRPGLISMNERNVLRDHTEAGYEILKGIAFEYPIADIIMQHHERMNGSGYPRGLSGDRILLEARIIGVADVVESMASHRPYRPSLGLEKALNEIQENRGVLYDEMVVDICMRLIKEQGYRIDG
jgi:PAS domain S-box-containing protein/putative nucleotidyltransferase with HDIG domain